MLGMYQHEYHQQDKADTRFMFPDLRSILVILTTGEMKQRQVAKKIQAGIIEFWIPDSRVHNRCTSCDGSSCEERGMFYEHWPSCSCSLSNRKQNEVVASNASMKTYHREAS